VFPARYELNSYIVFRKRLVSKRLSTTLPRAPSSCKLLMLTRSFSVHRPGPTVVAAGEGKLGDALPREGAPSCGQSYVPGPSVQLPGTSYRLEMFHVSHLCVSTHLDVSSLDVGISQGGLYHVTAPCACAIVWRSLIHINIVTI
jgi:hypothetical protein